MHNPLDFGWDASNTIVTSYLYRLLSIFGSFSLLTIMYTQSRIFVISLAAALTACGGSNQPTSPKPVSREPVSQPDPASVVQLNSAAETRAFAHEVFEKMAATSRDVIATMPIAKVPCVLGTPDCVLPSEPSNEMVGLDLIAAATDPSATLPGGRAWLRESAPKGQGTTSDGSPGIDQDISTSLSMTRASSLSKSSSSNLLSVTGVNGGAVIVDPLSGTNERRVKLHFTFRNSEYPNGGEKLVLSNYGGFAVGNYRWTLRLEAYIF